MGGGDILKMKKIGMKTNRPLGLWVDMADGRISELEDKSEEITQNITQKIKRWKIWKLIKREGPTYVSEEVQMEKKIE